MTKDEIKAKLDEKEVEYPASASKADLESLATDNGVDLGDSEESETSEEAAPTEEQPSITPSADQLKEVNYKEGVAPSVSELEYATKNPSQDESPEGDVVKDGVIVSTKRSRREAEKAAGE